MKIDTEWFMEQIKNSPYKSLRQFGEHLKSRQGTPLNIASVSLMLRGKRGMRIEEAKQIAGLLDVPLLEVLRHAGLPKVVGDGSSEELVTGAVDSVLYESILAILKPYPESRAKTVLDRVKSHLSRKRR